MKVCLKGLVLGLACAALAAGLSCHKAAGGSDSDSTLGLGTNPLNGRTFQVLFSVNDMTYRRTGGCRLTGTGAPQTVGAYDGCIFPASGGYVSMDIFVVQDGNAGVLRVHDHSRDGSRANNLSTEIEDCWTGYAGAYGGSTDTMCFVPPGVTEDYFEIPGTFSFDSTTGSIRFTGVSTQRLIPAVPSAVDNWFPSNVDSNVYANSSQSFGGMQGVLGNWPERIRVDADIEFSSTGGVTGSLLWQDRDPDKTATRFCSQACLTRKDKSDISLTTVSNTQVPFYFDQPSSGDVYFDLFPYCNPEYLTNGPLNINADRTTPPDGLQALVDICSYEPTLCPAFSAEPGLRNWPFCATTTCLPDMIIDPPGYPTGTYTEIHAISPIVDSPSFSYCPDRGYGGAAGDSVHGYAPIAINRFDQASYPVNATNSAALLGCFPGTSTAGQYCQQGPIPCCDGANCDSSWTICHRSGVHALSRAPYSTFVVGAVLTDADYFCPISPSPGGCGSAIGTRRNVLIPFKCSEFTNRTENCAADDVYILFDVSG
jgi:hypothetical protein